MALMGQIENKELIKKAQYLVEHGQLSEGQELLEGALGRGSLQTDDLKGKSFLILGKIALLQGNFEIALMHLKTAQRKAPERSWIMLEAQRLEGNVHLERGQLDIGLTCYQTALTLAKELGITKSIVACLNNIALTHVDRGEYDQSLELFENGLKISQETNDKEEIAKIYNNQGLVFYKRGQYDLALDNYNQSAKLGKDRDDKLGEAISKRNMADIYLAKGDLFKALECLREAQQRFEDTGFKLGVCYVLRSLSEIYWSHGELNKAIETLTEAITLCRNIGIISDIYPTLLLLLSEVHTDAGGHDEAEDLLSMCIAVNENLGSEALSGEIAYTRGYLEAPGKGRGNLGDAKQAYLKAISISEKLRLIQIWLKASLGLTEVSIGESMATLDESKLVEAEEQLTAIFEQLKVSEQIPLLCQVLQLQGLLAIAKNDLSTALDYFKSAWTTAETHGLPYIADKAKENYERASQLITKGKELLTTKKSSSVQEVLEYCRNQVSEIQRMIRK